MLSMRVSSLIQKMELRFGLFDIINNRTKEFLLEASKYRDTNTIKKFLYKFIDSGNIIISDGWSGYNFISNFYIFVSNLGRQQVCHQTTIFVPHR